MVNSWPLIKMVILIERVNSRDLCYGFMRRKIFEDAVRVLIQLKWVVFINIRLNNKND